MAKNNNRFHVNKQGEVGVCQAKKGICPFQHFDTKDEANSYSSKQGEKNFGVFGKKKQEMKPRVYSEPDADKPFGRRKRVNKPTAMIIESKVPGSYYHKIKSISFYNSELKENVGCYHYEYERKERMDRISEAVGEGVPVDRFVIDDGRSKPQIHEIRDNGRIIVYDLRTHKPITSFVAKENRIIDIYDKMKLVPPKGLIEKAADNESKKYNRL